MSKVHLDGFIRCTIAGERATDRDAVTCIRCLPATLFTLHGKPYAPRKKRKTQKMKVVPT